MQPKITIVTVTYNIIKNGRKKSFIQNLKSVHNQTYKNIEHLIIDGASDDGTLDLIKKYASKGWITYFSEPDKGIYDAMNKGIEKAKGEYISFLNSDDFYNDKNGLKTCIEKIEKDKADFSYCYCLVASTKGHEKSVWYPQIGAFFAKTPFCHQTMIASRNMLLELGKFDLKYKVSSDFDLIMRAFISGFKSIKINTYFITFRSGGESEKNYLLGIDEAVQIQKKNLDKYAKVSTEDYYQLWHNQICPKNLYDTLLTNLTPPYKNALMAIKGKDMGNYLQLTDFSHTYPIKKRPKWKKIILKALIKLNLFAPEKFYKKFS